MTWDRVRDEPLIGDIVTANPYPSPEERRTIPEYDLVPLSPAWLLAAFKRIMADTLYRVAKAVREGAET